MKDDYRLGEWTVRPQVGCIERDEEVVHLKPKVMAVLNCLAGSGGQVVRRDELFEAVWPGQVVSDATLTQCVVELRHAFGDSARNPKVVETIPKIGFRLILTVGQIQTRETHLPLPDRGPDPDGSRRYHGKTDGTRFPATTLAGKTE